MLGSPASRAAAQTRDARENSPVISESREERASPANQFPEKNDGTQPRKDPSELPRQVIYHFAVGRAVPDPRLEA